MAQAANMIVLARDDNVGVALRDIAAGALAQDKQGRGLTAEEAIPQGHKIALVPISTGQPIVRFSMPVGSATQPIAAGTLVHIHNAASQYLNNDHDHYE